MVVRVFTGNLGLRSGAGVISPTVFFKSVTFDPRTGPLLPNTKPITTLFRETRTPRTFDGTRLTSGWAVGRSISAS